MRCGSTYYGIYNGAAPGLLLLGAFGLLEFGRAVTARRAVFVAGYLALLAPAATLAFWPRHDESLETLQDYNTGLADLHHGQFGRARLKLERVYARRPDNTENVFALGNLYLAVGERARAKAFYRRTLELEPTHSRVLNNLGVLALEESRWELASRFLAHAVSLNPEDAKTYFLLARAQQGLGDLESARAAAARAVELDPVRVDFVALRDQLLAPSPPSALP